ncbi:MAG: CMP-N,N'-diacetyllegionaminic acid synthase [Parabacteroides sp.]
MKILAIIPARGGSKGLPNKNIREFFGKPLICWTIDAARGILQDEDICVSTDSVEIRDIVESYGLKVPFLRPKNLASDTASTRDVIIHTLNYYKNLNRKYDIVLLLQPTSPLRTSTHIKQALSLYSNQLDMVVSVKISHAVAVLAEENTEGYLNLIYNENGLRRQDITRYYEYNGAIYIINVNSIQQNSSLNFKKKIKYVMNEMESVDIDNLFDFEFAEIIYKNIRKR